MLSLVFKKGSGCRNAIHTVRKTVDRLVKDVSTVNMCAVDLSTIDKVNHSALYLKLMKRNIPVKLLDLIVDWFSDSYLCVK